MQKLEFNISPTFTSKYYDFEVEGYYDYSSRKVLVRDQEVSHKGGTYLFVGNDDYPHDHNFYLQVDAHDGIVGIETFGDIRRKIRSLIKRLQKQSFYLHGPYINVDKNNLSSHRERRLIFDQKVSIITSAQKAPVFYDFKTEGLLRECGKASRFEFINGLIFNHGARMTVNYVGTKGKTNVVFYIRDGKVSYVKVPASLVKTRKQKESLMSILKDISMSRDIYEVEFLK